MLGLKAEAGPYATSHERMTTEMRPATLSLRHLDGLDGVRGIAIFLVLIIHLGVMIPVAPPEHAVFAGMSAGWIGVDLFFVLSGMLITGILIDSKGSNGYFRNFYVRRVLRIFPLYYALLIFSFYILPMFPHPKVANFSRVTGDEVWYWLFLTNIKIAMAGGPRHAIMDVTWSLAIEEQFYLVWPLLVHLLTRARLALVCAALFLVAAGLRIALLALDVTPWTLYVITPTRIDGLCAGALVAIALRTPGLSRETLGRVATAVLAAGTATTAAVAAVHGGLPWDGYGVQTIGYASLAVMFGGLVLKTALLGDTPTLLGRLTRMRFLTTLGVLSYSLYLLHLPLRAVLRDTIMRPAQFPDWFGGTLAAQLVFYIAGFAVAIAFAWLSYHLFEKHFLRLKDVFAPRDPPQPVAINPDGAVYLTPADGLDCTPPT